MLCAEHVLVASIVKSTHGRPQGAVREKKLNKEHESPRTVCDPRQCTITCVHPLLFASGKSGITGII